MIEYPWEAMETVLRTLKVPQADVVARQVIDLLDDSGWRLVSDRAD